MKHPEIELAIVFGSIARDDAGRRSDVDLAVQLPTPLDVEQKMQLIADIAAVTGRPVDLVDLRTVGEPLLGQILKHGQRIRGEAVDLALLMQRHVYAMEDFMPYVERMFEERRQAWPRLIVIRKLDSWRRCLDRVRERCPADVATLAGDPDLQDIVVLNLSRAVHNDSAIDGAVVHAIATRHLGDFEAFVQNASHLPTFVTTTDQPRQRN